MVNDCKVDTLFVSITKKSFLYRREKKNEHFNLKLKGLIYKIPKRAVFSQTMC